MEILVSIIGGFIVGVIIGVLSNRWVAKRFEPPRKQKVDKFKSYYGLLTKWYSNNKEGNTMEHILLKSGYKRIAIYGMGEIGTMLYDALEGSSIEIAYAMDRKVKNCFSNLDIHELSEEIEEVDAIIVTVPFAFESVKKEIEARSTVKVESLEYLLFDV